MGVKDGLGVCVEGMGMGMGLRVSLLLGGCVCGVGVKCLLCAFHESLQCGRYL